LRYNSILDKAPGEHFGVALKTDFKQALKFFRVMEDKELDDDDKSNLTVKLFVYGLSPGVKPEDIVKAIEKHLSGPDKKDEGSSGKKSFCFNADHGLLLAAFRQVYNIDLKTESMHWWDFLELFGALPDGTHLMKVIEIRNKEIPKKGDQKYIRSLRKLKRIYSLDQPENTAKQVQDGISSLMGFIG